ncbi:hypothetical protein [Mobiluncus mulieris]|uniref:hypothetical protein n=1 Tax=Mobiluncus mulieris TaxID=2052 RepID=UPI0014706EFE|nr:hypothetical protein [Mobiluncus mulieris]NMX19273.1 hypothetical protein [Mobiluncus mulieris]
MVLARRDRREGAAAGADAVVFPEPEAVFPPEVAGADAAAEVGSAGASSTDFEVPDTVLVDAATDLAGTAAEVGSAGASSTDFEVPDTVLVDAATDLADAAAFPEPEVAFPPEAGMAAGADAVVFPEPGVVFPPEVAILLVFADFFAVVIDAS